MAQADAERLAGRKPLLQRLLERLRPHREEPGSGPQNFPGNNGADAGAHGVPEQGTGETIR